MDKKKIYFALAIVLLTVVAVWLRLMYIDVDFWYDEACSWVAARKSFPLGIVDYLLNKDLQHTPLYYFLLHFWMQFFGESEVAIRSLSLIFGIATVPMMFVVARKIVSKNNAFLVTLLCAFSPLLVFYSTEARMYPIVVFLVLLSLNYLIDFEQKDNDIKSLIKLVIVDLLIPYTLVGGIFYNFVTAICYGKYLSKTNNDKFKLYRRALIVEGILLVPYIMMICHYAALRQAFIVRHEAGLYFINIVEVVRNFFGTTIVDNPYWPSTYQYTMDFWFTVLVVVPCVYFVYGIVQGFKNSSGFVRVLYNVFLGIFVLAIISSLLNINVFTMRYILYLLPPLFMLGVIGLSQKISVKHLNIFVAYFVLAACVFNISFPKKIKIMKTNVFKAVQYEVKELDLNTDDVLIMPFGADAPYYFRKSDTPRVFPFDFHKQVRNPNNSNIFDENQQKMLVGNSKAQVIYDAVFADRFISENFYNFFMSSVNATVPSGRYVLIAFLGEDAQSVVTLKDLRNSVTSVDVVKANMLGVLLKKINYDMIAMLNLDFDFVKSYQKDNYTYFLFKKR